MEKKMKENGGSIHHVNSNRNRKGVAVSLTTPHNPACPWSSLGRSFPKHLRMRNHPDCN